MAGDIDEIKKARSDAAYRERFIAEHKRFILAAAYRAVNRYVTESDDEWAVALTAFNEAIDAYDGGKGGFLPFAQLVISRRLQNLYRYESRFRSETATSPQVMEGDLSETDEADGYSVEVRSRIAETSSEDRHAALTEEIDALDGALAEYGIDFFDLESVSPKAGKTREACLDAIRAAAGDGVIYEAMRRQRALPIQSIIAASGVKKKLLERHRKYLIAAIEIVCGDYPLLREYIPI